MDIVVVGCGYVGLVTAVGLAHVGHRVTAVEADPTRRAAVASGLPPFFEPGLEELLVANLADGGLTITDDLSAVRRARAVFLAVQTPPTAEGANDVRFLRQAAQAVGRELAGSEGGPVVAVRSTVVPGTVEGVVAPALSGTSAIPAANPEFLREGSAVDDFLHPDRVVVGCGDPRGRATLQAVYAPLGAQVFALPTAAAEMAKYTSNALLATMISFSNEIAGMCEDLPGVDVEDVLSTLHADRRLAPVVDGTTVRPGILGYLRAGCGYGGSCLPKDVAAVVAHRQSQGRPAPLLSAVAAVNGGQPARLVALAERALDGLHGRRVALLGLAFKAGTDDLRASPALDVARLLVAGGADVVAFDPLVATDQGPGDVARASTMEEAIDGADVVVLCTNAPEFRDLSVDVPVVDGRRDVDPSVTSAGYYGIGLGTALAP